MGWRSTVRCLVFSCGIEGASSLNSARDEVSNIAQPRRSKDDTIFLESVIFGGRAATPVAARFSKMSASARNQRASLDDEWATETAENRLMSTASS